MTADEIKALVERLQPIWYRVSLKDADVVTKSANALTVLLSQVETLTLENQRLRVDADRYRWLESRVFADRGRRGRSYFGLPLPSPVSNPMQGSVAEHFGAAVDAARAQIDNEKPL